jgi:hypothetical protein
MYFLLWIRYKKYGFKGVNKLIAIKKLAITREVWQYRKEDYVNLKKEPNDYYND